MRRYAFLIPLLIVLQATSLHADWTRFRGPNGSGISDENAATPAEWTPETVQWKTALPGPGSSCPIVVGDKVFVTCWTGARGNNQNDLLRHLVCLDRATGNELWRSNVSPVLPEDRFGGMFAEHGYASHTPVSDGKHVFAFFGKSGVIAYDMNGQKVWHESVGTGLGDRSWGSSSSPILHGDLLIVPATAESRSIIALDKATGEQKWTSKSDGYGSTWGTPILVNKDGRTDVVIAVPYELWGINAKTGKLAWFAESINNSSACSSCVVDDKGRLYTIENGPRGGGGAAFKGVGSPGADKKAVDITKSHALWSGRQSGRIVTPIAFDGKLFTVSNKIFSCLDAATGKEVYRSRLQSRGGGGGRSQGGGRGRRGGQDYGSPVMADGKIYFTSRGGETFVIKVGNEFEQLAVNRVTEDKEDFSATPAISDGQFFLRSDKHLYCVK